MAKVLGMNQPPQQPQIDITKAKDLLCPNCDHDIFLPAMKFRKLSKLLAGTQKDAIIPIEVYCCANCGEIIDELLPHELQGK